MKTSDRVWDGNNSVDIVNSLHWYTSILPLMEMEAMKKCTNSVMFCSFIYFE